VTQSSSRQEIHLNRARASLQQALSWYASSRRHWNYPPNPELQAAVRQDLQSLKGALEKLEQKVIKIAAFGLVSRGKSAVLNAIIGEKLLDTGPLHGVTQWPKSVRWLPPSGKIQVEFIDTPGLDEISGEARAAIARDVARQADLLLFVVAGDITRTEYQALCQLRQSQKPLLLVFNKIDLYPQRERQEISEQLQKLGTESRNSTLKQVLSPEEIVMVAAEPQPIPVRLEYPDGSAAEQWETPAPQIEELREKILALLNRQGRSLLALNALCQAREAEENIARKTLEMRQAEAESLILNYAKYKAIAVAANPFALLDVLGGMVADLFLIRSLARLYGLPITSYEAGKLWRTILASSGGILLGEIGSSFLLGLGKSGAAVASAFDSPAALTQYASAALMQGGIAAYGSYAVGKAAQQYLEGGCSWGSLGPSSLIQEILGEMDSQGIAARLRQEML
jgi:small GTP-binding protein